MSSIKKILELAKTSPLTVNYLVEHGFHINTAHGALKRAYEAGLLERTEFTTDTKAKKIAHRYTLVKKNIRQLAMEFITEKCTFTSKDLSQALGVSRLSAMSAITDLEIYGKIKRIDDSVKDIKFTLGNKENGTELSKCLQELKKDVRMTLNNMHDRNYRQHDFVRKASEWHAILERAEVKDA